MNLSSADLPPAPPSAADPSIDELDAAICRLARQLNSDTYRWLMLVRDFDDRCGWAKWASRNCADWLALRCGMTLSTAREKLRTAHALREMPAVSAAFADGRLSYSKVRALTRMVEYHNEEQLLKYALDVTAEQLEERCREIRNGEPESIGTARRAWERRSLTLRRNRGRGTMSIMVEVPLEDGELIARALERAVESGEAATGYEFAAPSPPGGVRDFTASAAILGIGWVAQQADALVAISKAYLAGGGDATKSTSVADHYQVVVHVDDSALRGGAGRSDLPIETVKRLTCDGSVITVVEDERGDPLDVGRKKRTVSTALKRALRSRDRSCTFPGCGNKRYVDVHHIRHWADGGETSLRNTTLLCSHHHRLVHEGGFRIRRDQEGATYFQRPDGRVIPRSGYRLDDMVDDYETAAPAENPSAEAASPRGPTAEVREARSRNRVGRSVAARPWV